MEQRSTLLAKLIGPPFLAAGLGLLLNQKTYWSMIDEVIRTPEPYRQPIDLFVGILSMLGGLAVIIAHPSWSRDWRVVITIIAWLLLVGGIVRIGQPLDDHGG
jgi:uncharacterized membrane protein